MLRLKNSKSLLLFLVSLFLIFAFSCGSKEEYAGTYFVQKAVSPKHYMAVIELKEDGRGVWRVFEEEVSFRWSVRGNEIRLHTREGGIIIGKIQGDAVEITLPGAKSMSFKKRQLS